MHQVSFFQESAKENELKNVSFHVTQILIAVKDHISTRCSLENSKKPSSSDSCVVKGYIQWDVLRGQTLLLLPEIQPLLPCEMHGYAMHVSEKVKVCTKVKDTIAPIHTALAWDTFIPFPIPRLLCQTWGLAVCEAPESREGKMLKEKLGLMGFLTQVFLSQPQLLDSPRP